MLIRNSFLTTLTPEKCLSSRQYLMTIGRDYRIPVRTENTSVSRKHVRVKRYDDESRPIDDCFYRPMDLVLMW